MRTITLFSLLSVCASLTASASTIAVIDSGTDLGHPELKQKAWNNPSDPDDAVDNDDNGLIDDTHGWNFAEGNNKLFNKRLIGKFSPEVKRFFEVQTRLLKGNASEDDVSWLRSKREDKNFLAELGVFGNFVHGTHVAGIAAREATQAQIMPIKFIPTQASTFFKPPLEMNSLEATNDFRKTIILSGIGYLAKAQGGAMSAITEYLRAKKPQVANCSFGTSVEQVKMILEPLIGLVMGRKLTEEELNEYSSYFVAKALEGMQPLVARNKATFFVFAAGNSGTNNDVLPTAPANLKADNTISVAATIGTHHLASFSNYGEKMVDVAAPGVGIVSAIPGGETLILSGTSQAAPYVANLAGRVWDVNPRLKMAEVKRLLMATVDKKEFLKGKVASQGVVNRARALHAAHLTLTTSLDEAITTANQSVVDAVEGADLTSDADQVFIAPMSGIIR